MFVFGLILLILGLVGIVVTIALTRAYKKALAIHRQKKAEERYYIQYGPSAVAKWVALGLTVAAIIGGLGASVPQLFYTQETRESVQLKDWTGNLVGSTTESGLHTKAPWVDTISFSTGTQQIVFAGASGNQNDNNGGQAAGPQITVQDQDGVTSNIDVAVRYSVVASAVTDIYKQFKTEDNFKKSFIEQDIRAVVREVPNAFSTIDLLTKRADVEAKIKNALETRWAKAGVTVDSISLQEIRAPQAVTDSYAAAQQAQIDVTKEQAKLDAAKVSSQQAVTKAEADAKANQLLTQSLTPEVLQQHYIDALKAGTVFVVPQGSNPLIQTPAK
ncbi:SPFH domain-containing protein [Leifsonia aquatica]|uniref:SPFH domain-containing protein n=1 Tax=Leifsonia aquatica TaxID=144185 RepID=UPI00046A1521|nr:SPFH domain-containing protein [Leifsonia aquatica]